MCLCDVPARRCRQLLSRLTLVLAAAVPIACGDGGPGSTDGSLPGDGGSVDAPFDTLPRDGGSRDAVPGDAPGDTGAGDGSPDTRDSGVDLRVTPSELELRIGAQETLAATVAGEAVSPTDVTLSVSDDDVARVDPGGTVTGMGVGEAMVTVRVDGIEGPVVVPVTVSDDLDPFLQQYIEALFLGSGPLVPQDGFPYCATFPGRWAAFPRGTTVRVRVSGTLTQGSDGLDPKALIEAALPDVDRATLGHIRTTFEIVADPDPVPADNEVTATDSADPIATGCADDRGCVHIDWVDDEFTVIRSSRTVLRQSVQPADAYVHDLMGHGILGMCHIDQMLIGGNDKSLMAGGPGAFTGYLPDTLSALDEAATRAVYGSELEPGASRAELVAAGLVEP